MDARGAVMLADSGITTNDGLVILHIQWMRGVGRAEGTIRGRRATLRRLERHGGQNPAGVTESQVESYLAMRRTGEGKGGRPVSDLRAVQEGLGHSSLQTTCIYVKPGRDALKLASEAAATLRLG